MQICVVQQTAKRCDDDGDGKYVVLRAAFITMAIELSPTNGQAWNVKQKRRGAKMLAAARRVGLRSSIVCFQPFNYLRYMFSLSLLKLIQPGTCLMHPLAVLYRI